MAVNPMPQEYSTPTPYLIVNQAADAIEFYKKAFGATEVMRLADAAGKIAHAEINIGQTRLMLSDEFPDMGCQSPRSLGGSPVSLMLYVADVDAQFSQALAAGATTLRPVEDQFYGDRAGTLSDPFGHIWTIATHIEDVSMEEINKRFQAAS
jgi:PhnB protein